MVKSIINYTNSEPKITYTWNSNWYHRYESAWSIFHKFMYANEIGLTELFKIFGEKDIQNKKSKIWSGKDGDLFWLKAFDEQKLKNILGMNLREYNFMDLNAILSVFEAYNVHQLFYGQPLRFCPTCIQTGYHSIFHQFKLFNICPLHKAPLTNSCPGCDSSFPNEYNLVRNDIKHPFKCRCGYSLIDISMKRKFAKIWDSDSFLIDKTELVIKLLSLKRRSGKVNRMHISDQIDLNEYVNPFDNLHSVLAPSSDETKHIVIKSREGINKIRDLDKKQFSKYLFTTKHNSPNIELHYSMEATYKSIARRIRKTFFKKHKQCIKDHERNISDQGICPYVYAYAHWRGHIENLNYYWHIHSYKKRRIIDQEIDFYSRADSNYLYSVYKELVSAIYKENNKLIYDTDPYILQYINEENLTTTKYIINRLFSHLLVNYFINWLEVAKSKAEKRIVYFNTPFRNYKGIPFYLFVYPTTDDHAAEFHFWPEKNKLLSSIPKDLKCPNNH
jgi:hypothetical protein